MKKRKMKLLTLLLTASMLATPLSAAAPVWAETGEEAAALQEGEGESGSESDVSGNIETATLEDGTYAVSLESSLGMFKFDDPVTAVVAGDTATVTIHSVTSKSRYDQMYIGTYEEVSADASGAIVGVVDEGKAEDGSNAYSFTFSLPTSSLTVGTQITYVLRYREGYSTDHSGDWYQSKNGDYYLTVQSVQKKADYTAVDAALARIPEDLSAYTDESVAALTEAQNAVVRDLTSDKQSEVDAMAAAIETAIEGLVEKSSDSGELQPGTETALTCINTTTMFKAEAASIAVAEDGSRTLLLTLSGTGYRYLYMGTYEEAVANGDQEENWIAGVKDEVASGKYTFHIPLAEDADYLPMVSISNSKLEAYKAGTAALEQAFFPRQLGIDLETRTLTCGDYDQTADLTVDNQASMFSVASAALETIGGPSSNNYEEILMLTMGSDSFDRAYQGSAEEAAAVSEEDTIAIGENRTFALSMAKNAKGGSLLYNHLEYPLLVSFHSVKKDVWYERVLTVSKTRGAILIESDRSGYTTFLIESLPSVDDVTLDASDSILEALNTYNALTDDEKAYMLTKDVYKLEAVSLKLDNLVLQAEKQEQEEQAEADKAAAEEALKKAEEEKAAAEETAASEKAELENQLAALEKQVAALATPAQASITKAVNTAKAVKITWKKDASATGYVIYRSVNGAAFKKLATVKKNSTVSYTDKTAKTNGATYRYKVAAYKTVSGTTYTGKASAVKTITYLIRPAIATAKNTKAKTMTVTWKKNAKASGYQLRYVLGKTTKTVTIKKASVLKKVIKKLAKGKTYQVSLRSYKKASGVTSYSAWSAVKKVKISK